MKFVVEAIGVKSPGGIEVALNLLSRFPRYRDHAFVALVPDLPQYAEIGEGFHRVIRFPPNLGLVNRHFILNCEVPRICKDQGADALLCLGNFAPQKPPCRTVVLLQNAWNVYDEPVAEKRLKLREKLTVMYGRRFYRRLPSEIRVVVQTPVMKARLTSCHGLDKTKIDVVSSAPPELDRLGRADYEAVNRLRASFTFLCLSAYGAHKNLEILLDAAKILRRMNAKPFRCLLTISAKQHPGARKLIARINREGMEHILMNIGPVTRTDLRSVYSQADACILPTLLETVGFAYDEAKHFGLPILTSDRDFARERCGNAATYFDPLCAESVARSMASVMQDHQLRRRLAENGSKLKRQAPSWEDVTARFVSILEEAAGKERPAHELASAFSF